MSQPLTLTAVYWLHIFLPIPENLYHYEFSLHYQYYFLNLQVLPWNTSYQSSYLFNIASFQKSKLGVETQIYTILILDGKKKKSVWREWREAGRWRKNEKNELQRMHPFPKYFLYLFCKQYRFLLGIALCALLVTVSPKAFTPRLWNIQGKSYCCSLQLEAIKLPNATRNIADCLNNCNLN